MYFFAGMKSRKHILIKNLLFAFVLWYAFPAHATICLKFPLVALDTTKQDNAKINTAIARLNLKLAELKEQLNSIQTQIPADSLKLEKLLSKSHEEQVKSKRKSEVAVGGDADDAKLAEKQAKRAAKHTKEAEQAAERLERSYKKLKDINKKIEKTQLQLTRLQINPI